MTLTPAMEAAEWMAGKPLNDHVINSEGKSSYDPWPHPQQMSRLQGVALLKHQDQRNHLLN